MINLMTVFIFIIVYIYSAICLQKIAKKVNAKNTWLAWIPVANLFLMCKIAGLKYWWLLIYLSLIIPILGPFIILGFNGFIWYKIALARNKPGWIGGIAAIPLVSLFTMGYLAFSEENKENITIKEVVK